VIQGVVSPGVEDEMWAYFSYQFVWVMWEVWVTLRARRGDDPMPVLMWEVWVM
jgi:hypothetical protein